MPHQRTFSTYERALSEGKRIYRTQIDIPKVIVCRLSDLWRVATIAGSRTEPRVIVRRGFDPA